MRKDRGGKDLAPCVDLGEVGIKVGDPFNWFRSHKKSQFFTYNMNYLVLKFFI